MFAELHHRELSAGIWGNKAARLSRAAIRGFPVPPALCVTADTVFPSDATVQAVAVWLRLAKPQVVAIRSSLEQEDDAEAARAGRGWTELNCRPIASELVERLASAAAASGETLCFMLQEQLIAPYGGVAFHGDGRLLVEIAPSTYGITSGERPICNLQLARGHLVATGTFNDVPVVTIASQLAITLERLQEIYEFPIDVEWGYMAGAIYLLQVRPITRPIW